MHMPIQQGCEILSFPGVVIDLLQHLQLINQKRLVLSCLGNLMGSCRLGYGATASSATKVQDADESVDQILWS